MRKNISLQTSFDYCSSYAWLRVFGLTRKKFDEHSPVKYLSIQIFKRAFLNVRKAFSKLIFIIFDGANIYQWQYPCRVCLRLLN